MCDLNEKCLEHQGISQLIAELEEKEKIAQTLVSTDDYIKWIENFTKEYPDFTDDDWLYKPDDISKENSEMVEKLSLFFIGIEKYASSNYIYPTSCDFGGYYSVKYNGKIYEIGRLIGQGTVFFCNTKESPEDSSIILFEDILNPTDEIMARTEMINSELDNLEKVLSELFKKEIPCEAIIGRADKVLYAFKKIKQ